tara:strand:+ start:236 stop:517 length:282 start_codon:yes stop_codon:yes gene_type:complete
MNSFWFWGSVILGGLALELFDVDGSTRIWIGIFVGGAFLSHRASKKEEKDRKIIEKIDERLDAIERTQVKQRDASLRIAKLQEEVERLQKLWF